MSHTRKSNFFLVALMLYCFDADAQSDLYLLGSAGTNLYIGENLTVQAEGNVSTATGSSITFSASGNPDFRLKKDFTNHTAATYTLGTEKIRFNGSTLQNADFGGDNVYGLYTDNANHVQITRNVALTGILQFGTGNIQSTAGAFITLETSATVTGVTNSAHNNGSIAKKFNSTSAFAFPVGDGSSYNPISFTPAGATATTMQAKYNYSSPSSKSNLGAGICRVSNLEYWDFTRTSGSENGLVTLAWDNQSNVSVLGDLVLAYWNGSNWINGAGTASGTSSAGTITSGSSMTSFNKFTLGTNPCSNSLPVELIEFKAVQNNNQKQVELTWTTATEINNDYFLVERSINGTDWTPIDSVLGHGNSNAELSYHCIDENPLNGTAYYRLRQVDYDHTVSYSKVEVVNFEGLEIQKIFPNPSHGDVNIAVNSSQTGSLELKVYDALGALIKKEVFQVNEGFGYINTQINAAAGKYFISVMMGNGQYYDYALILIGEHFSSL